MLTYCSFDSFDCFLKVVGCLTPPVVSHFMPSLGLSLHYLGGFQLSVKNNLVIINFICAGFALLHSLIDWQN